MAILFLQLDYGLAVGHKTFCPTVRSVIVLVNSNKSHSCLQWCNFVSCFCNSLNWTLRGLRDLSEVSRGGGGVETEGGSQLFEPQKREGS